MKSLDASFFVLNRERAMEKLQGGLLVAAGYTGMQRGNDAEFKFEQEANFWYLTGLEFPDWWIIMDAKRGKSWLVEPDIDEKQRLFQESLLSKDAKRASGITDVLTRDAAMTMLRTAAKSHQLVYTIGLPQYHDHFGFIKVFPDVPYQIKAADFGHFIVRDDKIDGDAFQNFYGI